MNKCRIPKWKVYFDGNFSVHRGRDHAGKEIIINREFFWDGSRWLVPSIYVCGRGLVIDFCVQISSETTNLPDTRFTPEAVVNGKVLREYHGSGLYWNPSVSEDEAIDADALTVINHYKLDSAARWHILRYRFPWATKRRPKINSLNFTFNAELTKVSGPQFHVAASGDTFAFMLPETGQRHTLTVQEYEQQEVPSEHFDFPADMDFPTHYTLMSYTITPDLPDSTLSIEDCAESDAPQRKPQNRLEPEAHSSFAVAIIGGSSGPTAIVLNQPGQGKLRAACSALHFEATEDVEWKLVFHEKRVEDLTIKLI